MRIAFIVPAPFELVTGGYQYDRRVVAELRRMGHEVCVLELAGRHPLPDDEARASARAIWKGLHLDSAVVIDNLGLASFSDLPRSSLIVAFALSTIIRRDLRPGFQRRSVFN